MGYLPDSETFHQTWTKLTKQNNEDCEMWLKALKKVSELTFYQTAKKNPTRCKRTESLLWFDYCCHGVQMLIQAPFQVFFKSILSIIYYYSAQRGT